MDLYFRRHVEWQRSYNCAFYNPDSWPREERVSKLGAFMYISSGLVEAAMYIPVIYVLLDKNLRQNFCYRLMLMLAVYDMLLLPAIAFATAYFLYHGMVFCDQPVLIYFIGTWLLAGWMGYSLCAVILAFNRCVCFTSAGFLFTSNWQYIWYITPVLYTIIHFIFEFPVIFNPEFYGWFFNPHFSYHDDVDGRYVNYVHITHNVMVATAIPLFYVIFYFFVRNLRTQSDESKKDRNLFYQILIVSFTLTLGTVGYFIMQMEGCPKIIIKLGHFNWIIVQICPAITYLTMNQTFKKKLFNKKIDGNSTSSGNRISSEQRRNTIEPVEKFNNLQ